MYIILGKTGYIAKAFIKELEERGVNYLSLSRSDIDYTDYKALTEYIDINWIPFTKSSTIINCAGYVGRPNVDACELNKDATIMGNVVFPTMLSDVCRTRGIRLIHISSGCIFSGTNKEFTEEDESNFDFNTGSFYSGTKELAERAIKDNPLCYIFRLRIPFDSEPSSRNYITKLLSYDTLIDVKNSLSHRGDFAKYCIDLAESPAPFGTYNVTNKGSITTREVVDLMRACIKVPLLKELKEFEFFEDYGAFEGVIKTPRSSCTLSTKKIEKYIEVRTVRNALEDSLSSYIIH